MKQIIKSASLALIIMLTFSNANATPSIYGRLDVAATHVETGGSLQSGTSGAHENSGGYIENNLSRLGIKGSEQVNDYIKAFYQVEFGIENIGADKTDNPFTSRPSFLGVDTDFGKGLIGRNFSVFEQIADGMDEFDNTNADIDRLVAGLGSVGDGLWYYSPKTKKNIGLNATFLVKSNQIVARGKDQFALSLTLGDIKLKNQNFYTAIAMNRAINDVDAYRFVGQLKLNRFSLGGLAQYSKSISKNLYQLKGHTYVASIKYTKNYFALKAQYGFDKSGLGLYAKNLGLQNATNHDFNIHQITIGTSCKIARSTSIYAHYSFYNGSYKNAVNQKIDLKKDNVISFGASYNF